MLREMRDEDPSERIAAESCAKLNRQGRQVSGTLAPQPEVPRDVPHS
jgi:hypothetical protein